MIQNRFNLNTIKILKEENHNHVFKRCLVIGKFEGGKRFKRGFVLLSKDEIRDIRLREIINY